MAALRGEEIVEKMRKTDGRPRGQRGVKPDSICDSDGWIRKGSLRGGKDGLAGRGLRDAGIRRVRTVDASRSISAR